ncbi:MAG: hypothetical protein COT89_00440 [Candidatus Colwellbacteria bacterium CG10_big_fil_rev_8_21_14_0_10_42_22]|uniref:DUF2680 domain-containing protein n=1 Tax=Candidatus Colwellbacteria bacterium CG10_big_fil_rev_8_21_14_0_10_42_22 TaxID=1974540 RepID=A0A2H0VII6_9BACT|nr:MAG: hypothetical protein COT89_00440 [Candidatus Colwellbacteria bacterium CG10_big_fil_rev_8_21_14_0_10_42_22]
MKNKFTAITLSALAVGLIIGGAGIVSADTGDDSRPWFGRFAEKFNLDQAEVQSFMQEIHEERMAEMQDRFGDRLDTAVENGNLTEAQKNLILEKHEEMRAERQANQENWQGLSPEERREQAQEHRAEMQQWAKDNGIDLPFFAGPEGGRGFGMHRGPGFDPNQ